MFRHPAPFRSSRGRRRQTPPSPSILETPRAPRARGVAPKGGSIPHAQIKSRRHDRRTEGGAQGLRAAGALDSGNAASGRPGSMARTRKSPKELFFVRSAMRTAIAPHAS
jgi:hypothetical protein